MPCAADDVTLRWQASDLRTFAQRMTSFLDPSLFPPGFPYPACAAAPTAGWGCPMPSKADAIDAELKARGAAALKVSYAAALAVAPALPQQRQRFYASHVVTQFAIWYHTAAALGNMSSIITLVRDNEYAGATLASTAALGHIEALLAAERAGEGGYWGGWHLHDWLDGYSNLRDVLRQLDQALHAKATALGQAAAAAAEQGGGDGGGGGFSPASSRARQQQQQRRRSAAQAPIQARPFRFGTGSWNSFFQYETVPVKKDGDAAFPFFYPAEGQRYGSFANAVRFRCSDGSRSGAKEGSAAAGACCLNSVIGGIFNCTGAAVELAAISPLSLREGSGGGGGGASIRYTLVNGTAAPAPTASTGTLYVEGSPVNLTDATARGCNPCSIAAQVFDANGVGLEPLTRATYSKAGVTLF